MSPLLARIRNHGPIARFPALHNLALTGSYMGVQATLAAPLCPSLQHFTGPCDLLPLVLLDTSCRRLTLLPCMPEELLKALEGVDPAPSITTLTLSLLPPQLRGWATPHGVFNRFSAVVDLRLHITSNVTLTEVEDYTEEGLLEIFVAILRAPIALEKATISWHSEHRIMGMQYGFESALRSAVPGLRSLCLEANDRSVSLSRMPGREFAPVIPSSPRLPPTSRVSGWWEALGTGTA
ncbi:hypothetical protein DFH08DRAFT_966184 [Mycena albidolilacea]|uniref:Uncharacterized protein n=1 Tax=Mycena albidolilacea TaxID=1033008 RepID=A0AAD7EK25_9AGAR|nr:hypothetical protein DFH08DRAFT_966184 [Mycena albidolilacea]